MSLEALEDWNPWWSSGEVPGELKGIERDKLREAKEIINLQKVKIYTGIRRSGKSTLLYQIIDCLLEKTDPKNIVLMNFDDIRLSSKPLDEIYMEYMERTLPQKPYILLDEIHNAANWTSSRISATFRLNYNGTLPRSLAIIKVKVIEPVFQQVY